MNRVTRCIQFVLMLGVVLAATPLWACSVPVFRYALERWQSDAYEVVVFHKGPLNTDQKKIVNKLSYDGKAGEIFANVELFKVDLDKTPDAELVELWKAQKNATLPWMVVRYPNETGIPVDPWSGPLSDDAVDSVMDSPKRREIARRILKGDSAVWVLLEIGDKKKDDAAFKILSEQIKILEKELKLPEIDPADIAQGLIMLDPAELKIKFSSMRLSRKNLAEKMFVEMLLGSEPDLREFEEPMVFPLFGRGRALYALVGKGINQDTIAVAGDDLTGPCTCTIKRQNPGTDMLMAVDWESLVEPQADVEKELPPLTGLGDFPEDGTDESQIVPAKGDANKTLAIATTPSEPASSGFMRFFLIAIVVLCVVFVVGGVAMGSKMSG